MSIEQMPWQEIVRGNAQLDRGDFSRTCGRCAQGEAPDGGDTPNMAASDEHHGKIRRRDYESGCVACISLA